MSAANRKLNFSAGPSALPLEVLERAKDEILNYKESGVSVMEMSHRSPVYNDIINSAIETLRELLDVPSNYKILFMHGGGTGQFAAVAMNLLPLKPNQTADYLVTGTWSQKAAKEAEKYGKVNYVLPSTKTFTGVPDRSEWKLSPDASYLYYCDNETIHGVEFDSLPESQDSSVPLVCDMSSNMLSRPVDISKFGLVYFGAQKNVGPAGVVVVVVREDLLGHAMPHTPAILDYKIMAANNSLYNTPPCYSIYMCGLVFEWVKEQGGVLAMEQRANQKSAAIYETIDTSGGFYSNPISKSTRSRMNVTFRVGGPSGDEALEKKFLEEATQCNMIQLKGHRSVGGLRASLYNAISIDQVQTLVEFMKDFQKRNAQA